VSEVLIQDTSFPARDGYTLAATVFAPAQAPRGAVLINSATAVPRKIYSRFATYLAGQGQALFVQRRTRCRTRDGLRLGLQRRQPAEGDVHHSTPTAITSSVGRDRG